MLVALLKRLAGLVAALFATALVAFVLVDLLPGDPALNMLGTEVREDTLAAARAELGLDRPPVERFLVWIAGIPFGDFGISYRYQIPVSQMILEGAAVTVPLGLLAILITTAIALPLGVYAAANQNRPGDTAVMAFSQIGLAVPNFWFAVLLILFFAVTLGWFDSGGFPGWDAGVWPAVKALLLPAFALALPQAAIIARVTRSAVLDVMSADFIRTARAKGLSQRAALWRHGLRNAMIPVVTVMGLQFAILLAGSVIIENVFYLPGLGRLMFLAISQNDAVVVRNMVVLFAGMIMIMNFLVDVTYALVNPAARIDDHPHRLSGGQRQRVVIAIALACRPRLLIADEPTTALDVTVQAQILDLLADLASRLGMSLILISHDLGVVGTLCQRTAVVYAGRLVEEGPTAELMAAPGHPYTRGLLAARPRLAARAGERLSAIPGTLPDPEALPEGCIFAPRCPRAENACRTAEPPMRPVPGAGHPAACIRMGEAP